MTVILKSFTRFSGGIADFPREGIQDSFAFARSIDIRSDPQNITVLPRTIKESGNIMTGLVKWSETIPSTLTSYMYDDGGTIYSRTDDDPPVYTSLRTVNGSHGNGLVYSQEDDFLYYPLDKTIGRYGPINSATPKFVDDFLGAQGGVPLNTSSLQLLSSPGQYASRADTASLSITGNLSISAQIKPTTLPTVNNQMTLVSKWDESGALRSYRLDIATVPGAFGNGSDGALVISGNTTENPIDSACTGTAGSTSLSATNVSFAAGQVVLIHQTRGTGAGTWMKSSIVAYTAGTITLATTLNATYTTGAQVRVMKQHTSVSINSGVTYTAKAWNGTTGGILAFLASGSVSIFGIISATGKGFRGGSGVYLNANSAQGYSGEGTVGDSVQQYTANGNGGGGGKVSVQNQSTGGGGGSHGIMGTASNGGVFTNYTNGLAGTVVGSADLTTLDMGGGGGGGVVTDVNTKNVSAGGIGGGVVFISSMSLTINGGYIVANGNDGGSPGEKAGAGGGGAGGAILLKVQVATLTTVVGQIRVTAIGGAGGIGGGDGGTGGGTSGGAGGAGRIHVDYYNSFSGTSTPTINGTQDNALVNNVTNQIRISISSTGSNSQVLTKTANLQIGVWQQVGVSWNATTGVATFYLSATNIGSTTGSLTSIHDNASTFQVGMYKNGSGNSTNFFNGLIDEVRVFNVVRSDADMSYGLKQQIETTTVGLVAYYKFNGDYSDATSNINDLSPTNGPSFVPDVPYPSPTTRLDIDQQANTTGSTYAVPLSISESAANRLTFTPSKDPQKSIQFNISAKGSGDWTITIHDSFNNVVDSVTITNANVGLGNFEFVFTSVWRPLTNFTNQYHAHITSTAGSGTIVCSSSNNLETASYVTYYQFLVEDTEWHPATRFLNYVLFGNERYIAKYEAPLYEPNKIVFEAGWRLRCFGYWQEYIVMGMMRGENIYSFDQGRLYFWDGISPTFNYSVDIPEGGINALFGSRGKLFIVAGYKNQLLVYEGGNSASKIKDMPNIEADSYSEIFPQGVCMWRSLLRYGVSAASNSSTLEKGVYTYGSTNIRYPEILTYDYPISTQNYTGSLVKIGCLTVVNRKLLIAWQSGTDAYGVDYVSTGNAPFEDSYIQFLIDDSNAIWREKDATQLVTNFSSLLDGESVTLSYALEGATTFTSNLDGTVTDDSVSRMAIANGRYHEIQARVDIGCTTTSPTVKAVLLVSNGNETELQYG